MRVIGQIIVAWDVASVNLVDVEREVLVARSVDLQVLIFYRHDARSPIGVLDSREMERGRDVIKTIILSPWSVYIQPRHFAGSLNHRTIERYAPPQVPALDLHDWRLA